MATQRFYDGQPGPDIRRELNNFEAILDGTVAAAQDASTDATSASVKAQQWADAAPGVEVETGKYSAKHWADRAQITVTGGLIYRGSYSAASGTFPATPSLGDYYKISAAGTLGGVYYSVGDSIIYNGTDWDKIDSTDAVTSVAGRVGEVVLTKGDVGLDNVDNTSDVDKPVSTATQTALDGKANTTHTHEVADVTGLQTALDGKANTTHTHEVADVTGLQTALDGKEPTIAAGTATQYWRGDKTWGDFFTDVRAATLTGLSTATNAVITATDTVLSALGKLQKQVSDNLATLTSHTGNTSNPHGVTKVQVGLGNVDNTSDANKPVSSATQAALNAKASTSHTHAVANVTGLQAALDGKQASLGFTPVQQGGPTGQGTSKVYIGWATDGSGLLCQVDGTNFGKSWPINVGGTAATVINQNVSPAVRQVADIGAAYVNWDTSAAPAVQLDAPNSNSAYMIWRATRWGSRHIAAMHVYEGSMVVTMSVGNLNNFTWDGAGNFIAAGNVVAQSDIRLKTDITKITDALSKVSRLNGYTYTRKDTGQRQTGVVAQELQEVLPEAVIDNGEHLAVAYGNIVGLLIEAIKELKSEVDQLKGK